MSITESLKHAPEEETRLHEMVIEDEKPSEPRLDVEEFIGEEEWEALKQKMNERLNEGAFIETNSFNGMYARIISERNAQRLPLNDEMFKRTMEEFNERKTKAQPSRFLLHIAKTAIALPDHADEIRASITDAEREKIRENLQGFPFDAEGELGIYVSEALNWKILFPKLINEINLDPSMIDKYIMPRLSKFRATKEWRRFLDLAMATKILFNVPYKDFCLTQEDLDDIAREMDRLRVDAKQSLINVEMLFEKAAAYKIIAADKVVVDRNGIHLTEHSSAGHAYKTEQPPRPVRRDF